MRLFFTLLTITILFSCSSTKRSNLNNQSTKSNYLTKDDVIQVLYLTGGWYHNYDTQTTMIKTFIPHYIKANVDSRNDFDSFSNPQIADGYDFIIINFCYADSKDKKIITNLSNIVKKGKSVLVIHGSMHTFRNAGNITNDWATFLGIYSKNHDRHKMGGYVVTKVSNNHIVQKLPKTWICKPGELYRVISTARNIKKLTTSYSKESKKQYVTSWYHSLGKGTVYGTTIGHFNSIYKNPKFQTLITNMILAGTNKLTPTGNPVAGYAGHKKPFDFSKIKNTPTPRPPNKHNKK